MDRPLQAKLQRVLQIVLASFLLIVVRLWYLAVFTHEEHVWMAAKPQTRTVIEQASRGTIRDRFNIPLAINTIRYDAAVSYDPIRRLPRYQRPQYIEAFSTTLSEVLDLNAQDIRDILYSKAALFPNMPFILKENISEQDFYRLKMLERKWPGLDTQITSKRTYPCGNMAASILGYIGAIDQQEYLRVHNEISSLETFINGRTEGLPIPLPPGYRNTEEVKQRLKSLKDRSYTIRSCIGKSGVEKKFEEDIRGCFGKQKYEVDMQGNYLRSLPESYSAIPGRRILLTISSELQAFAEALLAQSEITREERFHQPAPVPWIKGGAIVAMIPTTGEVVTLASYPKFNPNDFATGSHTIHQWLETPRYIGQIWDGCRLLERDFSGALKPSHIEEKTPLTWEGYLNMILAPQSTVRKALQQIDTVYNAVALQNAMDQLFALSPGQTPLQIIKSLSSPDENISADREEREARNLLWHHLHIIPHDEDRLLALDLCRLAVHHQRFDSSLLPATHTLTISEYRSITQAVHQLSQTIDKQLQQLFHLIDFSQWRQEYFTHYLKEKRKEEKIQRKYQKPYLEYLQEMEALLYQTFFQKHRNTLLLAWIDEKISCSRDHCLYPYLVSLLQNKQIAQPELTKLGFLLRSHLAQFSHQEKLFYLETIRSYEDLTRPLWGRYYFPAKPGRTALEKDLARHFYPTPGFGYARSYAFQETAPQGSIFKIITAYEALKQHYTSMKDSHYQYDLNPLTIIDECKNPRDTSGKAILGYTMSGTPITRYYKGGRLPRSHKTIGKTDILSAIEQSSNVYFSLLASDVINDPLDLNRSAKNLGFGSKTGIDLTGESEGILPYDLHDNRSGLYSLAIGQHSLTVTPLQTATMLSAFVNNGEVLKPQIVRCIANMEPDETIDDLFKTSSYAYAKPLANVGIYFPLFTEAKKKQEVPYIKNTCKTARNHIFLPSEVQKILLSGMYRVINGDRGAGREWVIKTLYEHPQMRTTYQRIKPHLIGKTGTAEILYRPCIDYEYQPILCKHIWFGGISFTPSDSSDMQEMWENPELVVVVYLRYGDYGKEAIPMAAEIINKWREIRQKQAVL